MIKSFFKNIKRVYKYSIGCRKYILMYLILSFLTMAVSIIVPTITSLQLVNLTEGIWDKVIIYSLFAFGLTVFRSFLDFLTSISVQFFSKKVISRVQIELGREILKIQLSDIDKHSSGLFTQRLTTDASDMTSIFAYGVNIVNNFIRDIGVIIIVFFINYWIGLFYIIYITVTLVFQKIKNKQIDKKDKELREQKEETTGFATELIRGIRDIKMLNAENAFMKKVENNISDLREKNYSIDNLRNVYYLVHTIIRSLFELMLILILIYFVKNNNLEISVVLVIYNYRYYVTGLVYDTSSFLDYARGFNLSCERVFSLFGSQEFKKEKFGETHLDKINGDFEFKNVEFSYDDADNKVLRNLSFKIRANETVAFVGKSGSGKTTIFNLICKFYDISSGSIKIDGIDINKLDKDTIRGNITIISQNPYIFNMSIKDNLKLVKEDLTEEEMKNACKMACLDEFINSLSKGYDTIIGECGVNLSGGQKQRLAIARALIQKTEIILFDEATSALDNETQAKIQKSIDNMKDEYTILIIAHRLSTIINCDRILFIEDGKIIAEGTHHYLLKNCQSYKQLYESENIEKN